MNNYTPSWMSEELTIFQESVGKFFENEYLPHVEEWEEKKAVDRGFWKKAAEIGLLAAGIPEEYEGFGESFAYEAVGFAEMGRLGISGFGLHVHLIATHYIVTYGTEEQKRRWLPRLGSGDLVGAIAMTEPGTGSDLQAIRTSAIKEGDEYVINGSKVFISNGIVADLIVLVAKTDPRQGSKGISLIVIETDDLEGFSRGKTLNKIGQKAQDTAELFFDNVRVPADKLLGKTEGQGFYQLMEQLVYERLVMAIYGAAVMELAVRITSEYTKGRKAFNKAIIEFQNTRFKLAEAKTEAYIGRVFVDHCIQLYLEGKLDAVTASMAKWWISQKQCDIVDECLQLHGGYGYSLEYPIAKLYVDSRVQKIYGGTNEIMKELIARSL